MDGGAARSIVESSACFGRADPVEREVVSLWLGTTGKLDRVPVGDVRRFESEFLDFIGRGDNGIFDEIRQSKALGDAAVSSLERAGQAGR